MGSPLPDVQTTFTEEQFNAALERSTQTAKKDGVFAGLSSGLASAIIGGRLMGLNRNKAIFCGIATGIISGYLFTQAFVDTAVAQARAERAKRASYSEGSIQGLVPSFQSK